MVNSSPGAEVELDTNVPGVSTVSPVRRWVGWLAFRLATGLVVLWVVTALVFFATQALPADPAQAILGTQATPERLDALRDELGLHRPVLSQYWDWLSGLVQGDLGTSLFRDEPITDIVGPRLVNSLILVFLSAGLAVPLSLLLGVYTARHRGGRLDRVTFGIGMVLNALPEFVLGMLLVILFATTVFNWLPAVSLFPTTESPLSHPKELVLPVVTLVLVPVAYLYRLVRASMIDVLESDFVQMAYLKGIPPSTVLRRHALPNALVPMIQATALVTSFLLGGTVIIEFLFRYPGLGSTLSDAVGNRDLPVIQGVVLVYAAGIVTFNVLADIATQLASPRLRTGGP